MKKVGNYRIGGKLGEGSNGFVYSAYRLEDNKKFAVKINTTKANTTLNKIIDNKVGETGMFWLENLIKKPPAKKNGIMKANPLKIVLSKRMLGGYRNIFCSGLLASINLPT